MRIFAVLLATVLAAVGASAQGHARLNAGFDFGYQAPSIGVGLEAGVPVASLRTTLGLRLSGDVVLVDRLPYADALSPRIGVAGLEADVYRFGLEIIAYADGLGGPARPYVKAGAATEYEYVDPALATSAVRADAVAGIGLEVGRLALEGTHGFGDASRRRFTIGVRF